uniref:Uncharacterized protein n=1 Tax=viral metagenome TaxID=1070528 RepID=A0A6C0H2W0_9ZZZZ
MTKWLNNFCENLVNGSNPRYCSEPVQTHTFMTLNQQEEQRLSQSRMFDEWKKDARDNAEWVDGLRLTQSDRKY